MIFAFLCKVDAKFGKVVMWENYPMKGKQTYKHKLSCQLPWEAIFQKDHYNLNSHAISTVMVIKALTYRCPTVAFLNLFWNTRVIELDKLEMVKHEKFMHKYALKPT